MSAAVSFTVVEGETADAGRGVARLTPEDLRRIGAAPGDILRIQGARAAHARAMPLPQARRGSGGVALDPALQGEAGTQLGQSVIVLRAEAAPAESITLHIDGFARAPSHLLLTQIGRALELAALEAGDVRAIKLPGGAPRQARIVATRPSGLVLVGPHTRIALARAGGAAAPEPPRPKTASGVLYADLGGLKREVARVREMVEWPLTHPEMFEKLGVAPPKGVLLSGPPGSGKTLLARAVANECDAAFFQIDGPEIVSKHYGESEEQLRAIFRRAEEKAPAVIFLDEIDAIAPKRESLSGDRQVERRIVGQLLTLLDGMKARGQVVVMAATNLPSSLDPALRRPGRFDREIAFLPPDRLGRREILAIHTAAMPLDASVDLDRIAEVAHGYVGADLAALAREAGMAALRRALGESRAHDGEVSVCAEDFDAALNEVGPSALRELASDIPRVKFDDIGGLDAIKTLLIESVVWPLLYPRHFACAGVSSGGGVLLHGAPGGGKTLLAKALAHEAGVNFISVRGPQLISQFLGESEKAVRELFAKARLAAPAIIFFDEIDALAPRRGGGGNSAVERVVAQLLTEMDGLDDRRGVFVLAATNRPDCVDPALLRPGRFDRLVEVAPPDFSARKEIFRVHLARRAVATDVDLDALARASAALSGAEIESVCRAAAMAGLRRAVAADRDAPDPISVEDLDAALAGLPRPMPSKDPTA
ncbi:transitional endoplasmic reticulum ATPase [Rhodoblastus acidophilus]|uniref:AAA family ATPase n=1 Tax=Rhodoblastus acidophilus TaxID=1074 RepID=UPI0022247A0B|nr:AAA family ATPase [Rhodoblastus acidophilus]MCW2319048.1 transitional endoplasmic reticulum ATPase [Rhodoblastus acidophilus]